MAVFSEGNYLSDVLKFEHGSNFSRENVTVLAGSGSDRTLAVGTVIGQRTVTAGTSAADASNVGDGTMGAITLGVDAEMGVYVLTCTAESADAGTFQVQKPSGGLLAALTVASAYTSTHISMTIADGAADFDIGDKFYITVGDEKITALDLSKTDGTQIAMGIIAEDVTALDGVDKVSVAVVRDAVLEASKITWPSSITASQELAATTQLKNRGIVIRTGA